MLPHRIIPLRRILGILLMVGGLGLFALVFPPWFWVMLAGLSLVTLGWAILRDDRWL